MTRLGRSTRLSSHGKSTGFAIVCDHSSPDRPELATEVPAAILARTLGIHTDAVTNGGYQIYRKINLAMNERGQLHPGDRLPTIDIQHPDGNITAGMQLCREIRFPEQWQYLAAAGAPTMD